jgi:2-phosphosulfolactate phosphatase
MKTSRYSLSDCAEASGTVIVIDVLRAFSTAAYALSAGASSISLVSTVEEALRLRDRIKGSIVMGEVGGLPVKEFDLSNSPVEIVRQDLKGKHLIQRTSAGTQGVVRCRKAEVILAGCFCCAAATARYLMKLSPGTLSLVVTGRSRDGKGDEDEACADYIEALLSGGSPDAGTYVNRVRESFSGRRFSDPSIPEYPAGDLELCVRVDVFDFAMPVVRDGRRLDIKRVDI